MTVPTLQSGTVDNSHPSLDYQLHSSNGITGIRVIRGIRGIWGRRGKTMVINLINAYSFRRPIHRIDLLSMATRVQPTSLQGQTIMAAGRAKMVVNYSMGTTFCVANLATGHGNVCKVCRHLACTGPLYCTCSHAMQRVPQNTAPQSTTCARQCSTVGNHTVGQTLFS